jgi:ethanolamine ammonia-lyase small subunit
MTESSERRLRVDPWHHLSRYTTARIALGRAGVGIPTTAHLAFQLAHAMARDAVHLSLDVPLLLKRLKAEALPAFALKTRAADRRDYLLHPDRGRRLTEGSEGAIRRAVPGDPPDVALVVADGLSAVAIDRHAIPFLRMVLPLLSEEGITVSPAGVVSQGRVAVADEVGGIMGSRMAVILIGERPGLSSPDSMGIYFTYHPRLGRMDAERNCISNIHSNGLSYREAAGKLIFLVREADRLGCSGVRLKEASSEEGGVEGDEPSFLLS